jgi:N utilization substance protein A
MKITLSDAARQYIALFEDETGATALDCLVFEDRVVVLVRAGQMAQAIGPDGRTVRRLEDRIDRRVQLVENADTPEEFVASALAPAAVRHVTISDQNDRVAYVEVPEADRGVAIGSAGQNIETARELARRHYDIDDIQLT